MPTPIDFQLLFAESPEVLLVLLPDAPRYTIAGATNSRLRVTHSTPASFGRGLFEVFPDNPDDPTADGTSNLRASLDRVLGSRQADTMPVQKYDIRGPDGAFQARYWSPKNIPVLGPTGAVAYILHRVEDVTDLVRASEAGEVLRGQSQQMEREVLTRSQELAAAIGELRVANAKLAELDVAKTAFFSNISHEFRTPLTLMLGPLEDELAELGPASPWEHRERIETAHRQGLRLLRLVNALLDFSRIEAGRMQAHFQPVDLAQLSVELASHFETAMERAGLRLIVDCQALPQPVYVDRDMWEKIVLNLLSNAFKHTFTGGVTVRLRARDTEVELAVEDTGIGIPAEQLPHLFERFYRVAGAPSRTHEGTGIGLSLVRELVAVHHGSVRVESEFGKGSRFIVTLPYRAAEVPVARTDAVQQDAAAGRASEAHSQEALSWLPAAPEPEFARDRPVSPMGGSERPRILLADDNADMRRYVGRLLGRFYVVEAVADGALALDRARAHPPDLVLSDAMMPRLDGFGLLKALRADERTRQLPVILLSARAGEESAVEGLDAGADDYLVKPFSARELLARVRAHLALARERRGLERELERRVQARTAEVARLTRALQMLSGINSVLVRIRDRDEVMSEACRLAHETGGYALAMVALLDPATRLARPAGWAGVELPGRAEALEVGDRESDDSSVIGRVIRTGTPILCEDVLGSAYPIGWHHDLAAAGIHSIACVPLRVDGTPVGALLFGASDHKVIRSEEMQLLEEVGANLSFALQYLNQKDTVHFLSYFEPLTGLAKRPLFCERLNRLLARGSATLPRLAVTVFDIAHLAVINDSHGRHTGDRLLQSVADRLREHLQDTEQLGHLGGGTFACVRALPEGSGRESGPPDELFAQHFSRVLNVDDQEILVEVRSGVACYPEDGTEASLLVQNAEAALKAAKSTGQRHLQHQLEANAERVRRHAMERRLRGALEHNQFELYYQPKVSLADGEIQGVEALLRWRDPEGGVRAPAQFLPLLESSGLMPGIGRWALRQAVIDCRRWRRGGLPPLRIAVNISPAELRRRSIAREILDALGDLAGESPWGIDIEITEGALAGGSSSCVHALRLLRASGMHVAIDDFGTGFSSLGRLSELPIDTLKIDRSFTSRLPEDRNSCTLVSTVISLAHAFGMSTVAEGVETRAQFEHLRLAGCDLSQGYFHSQPLPAAQFEAWLGQYRSLRLVRVDAQAGVSPASL
jgi:diguanylate cyclase (GGDEF)-like protein